MQLMKSKRAITRAVGILVAVIAGTGGTWAAIGDRDCTIDGVAINIGIDLIGAETSISTVVTDAIGIDTGDRAPGAVVQETKVALASSKNVPSLDGHRIVLQRLEKVPDQPISGPIGSDYGLGAVKCAVDIYDADTGEFLFGARRLEPRST